MTTLSSDSGNNGYTLKKRQLPPLVQKIVDIPSKKDNFLLRFNKLLIFPEKKTTSPCGLGNLTSIHLYIYLALLLGSYMFSECSMLV